MSADETRQSDEQVTHAGHQGPTKPGRKVFESAVEWVERCGRPADIGPPDPPDNPYDRQIRAGGDSDV